MKKVLFVIAIALALLSGCLESKEGIVVDYDDDYGLHYAGTIIKDRGKTTVNITINGTLDDYPLTGSVVGPATNATAIYEVRSLYHEVYGDEQDIPNFTSKTYHDITGITSMSDIKYGLLTNEVVTGINCTVYEFDNQSGVFTIDGTLTQIHDEEPYYNLSITGADEFEMMKYKGTIIGPETNVTMYVKMGSALGSMEITMHKDLNAPEDEYLTNGTVIGTGIFAGVEDGEMPGFGGIVAITMVMFAMFVWRRMR